MSSDEDLTLLYEAQEQLEFNPKWDRLINAAGAANDAELAKLLGITPPSVTGVKKRKKIPLFWYTKIAEMFGVSLDWLILGKGNKTLSMAQMLPKDVVMEQARNRRATDKNQPKAITSEGNVFEGEEYTYLPVYDAAMAGVDLLEAAKKQGYNYAIRTAVLNAHGNADSMILVRVSANNMEPMVMPGGLVLVDLANRNIIPGAIYLVDVNNLVYTFSLEATPDAVVAKSINPDFPPVIFDDGKKPHILGRVLLALNIFR